MSRKSPYWEENHHHPQNHLQPGHLEHPAHNFAEENVRHFDASEAQRYDERPEVLKLACILARAMRDVYAFDESSTTLMDYACGTGSLSRELAPYTQSIVGVDISQAMIDRFNTRVDNQGIPKDQMRAVCADLKGQESELDGMKFDVIVCSLAYHHLESIEDVTRILTFFLKPGGILLVADIAKAGHIENLFPDGVAHIVAHRMGFDEEDLRKAFDVAGLESFKFDIVDSANISMHGREVDFFIAQGFKPRST